MNVKRTGLYRIMATRFARKRDNSKHRTRATAVGETLWYLFCDPTL